MKKTIFAFFAIISLFILSVFAQSFAITNARIVTVSGSTIEKGTVVIRDGLIADVGASARVPADARVFDGNGLTVYPGLFDTNSNVGLAQAPARPQGAPGAGAGQAQPASNSNYPAGLQPENMVIEKLSGGESQFEQTRNAGFTTVLTVSRDGIFNGQSAVINLAGENVSAMVLRPAYAQHVTYRTLPGVYPGSLLGTFSAMRQMFLDAQRLDDWKKKYAANPKGMKRPDADASLEALIPLLNRTMPVVFNANSEIEIIRSLDFAKEFNLRPIIAGGYEAGKVADRLKKADAIVLLSLNFPKKTTANSPDADPEPLDMLRLRVEVPKNAAKLSQAGVKFAFQTGGLTNLGEFLANANKAVENGLSKENALKAMTLDAAEILGVADRLGSIEKGKIANLVVTRGDILARDKAITHVFVDGKLFEQRPPAARPTGAGTGTGTAPTAGVAQVAGTWNITIDAQGQSLPVTLTFQQQGSKLTGTMNAQMLGSSEVKNGEVTADGFRFDTTVNFGGQSLELVVSGKVTGNQVSGTVTTPMGPASFSGTKVP
jgi:imidazolonepropionase-like amidohydrolase